MKSFLCGHQISQVSGTAHDWELTTLSHPCTSAWSHEKLMKISNIFHFVFSLQKFRQCVCSQYINQSFLPVCCHLYNFRDSPKLSQLIRSPLCFHVSSGKSISIWIGYVFVLLMELVLTDAYWYFHGVLLFFLQILFPHYLYVNRIDNGIIILVR